MKYIKTFEQFINEASEPREFKHISSRENKIKLAIKDVEKQARLKINRDKEPEYDQLSLNKIMLSKVLDREKLGKEHLDAWKKLKKEYSLKESYDEEIYEAMSKKELDKEIQGIKQDLAGEGMPSDQKYDMAESILDDDAFMKAIKKHYKVSSPVEWLADRI